MLHKRYSIECKKLLTKEAKETGNQKKVTRSYLIEVTLTNFRKEKKDNSHLQD